MSKIPPKFEALLDGDPEDYPTELKELLASKPPEYWGVKILNRIGHKKEPKLRTMRKCCNQCTNNQRLMIRYCPSVGCALWKNRLGTDPFRGTREAEDA